MTKKLCCALARICWPSARFWDFFGLQKGFGLLQAKKIPKRPSGQKTWLQHKIFFVLPHDEKCRALTHELHFSTLSKFFPLQKVNFPVPKIPLGQIYFLSLLARKTRMRARMKKRAEGRKWLYLLQRIENLKKNIPSPIWKDVCLVSCIGIR